MAVTDRRREPRTRRTPRDRRPCAYCGVVPGNEVEHVFPLSWYPDTTPAGLEKLKVPSCGQCNDGWERIEDALAFNLAVTISPSVPEAAGIAERQLKAINVAKAKNGWDRKRRAARAEKLLRTMKWLPPIVRGPRVWVQSTSGLTFNATPARQIDNKLWTGISEKFVRGLHHAETGAVLPQLDIGAVAGPLLLPNVAPEERKSCLSLPLDRSVAPAFLYGRVHTVEVSAWRFAIWGQISLVALVTPGVDPATVPPDATARSRC
jgi:hypothetical protein